MAGTGGGTPTATSEAIEAAAAFGLPAEQRRELERNADDGNLEIWPENWRPVCLAIAMQTQWRTGPGGLVGYDYTVLPMVERLVMLPAESEEQAAEDFAALQVIEREILQAIRASNARKHRRNTPKGR